MQDDDQQRLFDQWLKSHRGLFFKVVRAYAFTPDDQEDLFQEFLRNRLLARDFRDHH